MGLLSQLRYHADPLTERAATKGGNRSVGSASGSRGRARGRASRRAAGVLASFCSPPSQLPVNSVKAVKEKLQCKI